MERKQILQAEIDERKAELDKIKLIEKMGKSEVKTHIELKQVELFEKKALFDLKRAEVADAKKEMDIIFNEIEELKKNI
jgi:hypothetical protein